MLELYKNKETSMEKKKVNLPQKDAGRRLADRLEKLGKKNPPKSLVDKINQDDRKKVAVQKKTSEDLEI
jgi:hypothetical protein